MWDLPIFPPTHAPVDTLHYVPLFALRCFLKPFIGVYRHSDSKIWTGFFARNFPGSTKTQRNKNIIRKRSTVLTHIFLHLHSKQHFKFYIKLCMYISTLLSKTCCCGIDFGAFITVHFQECNASQCVLLSTQCKISEFV